MSSELRHDIPILICVMVFFGFLIGSVSTRSAAKTRFDHHFLVWLVAACTGSILLGIIVYWMELPGSDALAAYVGVASGGVTFLLGIRATNRIDRWMAWK